MTREHLLPGNATKLERAVSETADFLDAHAPAIDGIRGFRFARPLGASFAAWIVAEYGLGAISRFFGTPEETIDAGIPWQRLRGTPVAVETALAWIGYDNIALLDQYPERRKWNRYQIAMGELPGADEVRRLLDAEFLASISDPARSVPFRGFHGYDVPAAMWSRTRWSGAIWGDSSGIRVAGGTVKWSHGRQHSVAYEATDTDRVNLGVDVQVGDPLTWGEFPWEAPGITWEGVTDAAAFRSFLVRRLPAYIGFYDADGEAIGFRRCFAAEDQTEGTTTATIVYRARTGFGDGAGRHAATCALVLRARNIDTAKPGKQWLSPDEIAMESGFALEDMTFGPVPLDIAFGETLRDLVTLTLEI